MISDDFSSLDKAHFEITLKLLEETTSPLSLHFHNVCDRPSFSLVGYSSNRWINYVDGYLNGGPPFSDFVDMTRRTSKIRSFRFGGLSLHRGGPCVLSLTVTPKLVHLNSRIVHWSNAGVLDLNFIWLLWQKYKRPIWFTCPRAVVVNWQLAGYARLSELSRLNIPIIQQALRMRKNPELLSWDRMRKKARRQFDHANTDEEEMVLNYERFTPDDLAIAAEVSAKRMRHILRENFGHSMRGEERASHSWSSFSDERFLLIAKAMKINPEELPPLRTLIGRRLARRAKEEASAAHSTTDD